MISGPGAAFQRAQTFRRKKYGGHLTWQGKEYFCTEGHATLTDVGYGHWSITGSTGATASIDPRWWSLPYKPFYRTGVVPPTVGSRIEYHGYVYLVTRVEADDFAQVSYGIRLYGRLDIEE